MKNHTYSIKQINSSEYHVLEYPYGLETDHPFVIAKCSGPVPANDILIALIISQSVNNKIDQFEVARKLLESNFSDELRSLTDVLRKYRCVSESKV